MPARVPKQCRFRGCSNLTTERHGYCDTHEQHAIGWRKTLKRKGNADQCGYGYQWRIIRKLALKRDNYLCQVCLAKGILTPATAVDHIINKANNGTDDLSNLQSICDPCHEIKTASESINSGKTNSYRG